VIAKLAMLRTAKKRMEERDVACAAKRTSLSAEPRRSLPGNGGVSEPGVA
jgi:hypothetical protein